jgi:CubicO group peptidase (beta-lactamase class C family)
VTGQDAAMNSPGTHIAPGICLLVRDAGGHVIEVQSGVANLEHLVHLAPGSVFNVGSVAKQITAYLAVVTARAGSLDLDTPVADILPRLRVPEVTVANLIRHDSGIRDAETLLSLAGFRDLDHYTAADLLALAYRQAKPAIDQGRFLYSNTNYLMLAAILETVHGTSLQEIAELLVFTPLGMRTARFKADVRDVVHGAVCSYALSDVGWQHQARPVTLPGPGSLWCSARDLDLWLTHLHQEWVRQGVQWPPFHAEVGDVVSDQQGYRYGAGLYVDAESPDGIAVFHFGHEQGFSAVTRLAANGARTICLSNNSDIRADRLAATIDPHASTNAIKTALETVMATADCRPRAATPAGCSPKTGPEPNRQPLTFTGEHVWQGTYACDEVPGTVRLSNDGTDLRLWRRGTADRLTHADLTGRTHAGPGYTLTILAPDPITHGRPDAFILDLTRAPGLHYELVLGPN